MFSTLLSLSVRDPNFSTTVWYIWQDLPGKGKCMPRSAERLALFHLTLHLAEIAVTVPINTQPASFSQNEVTSFSVSSKHVKKCYENSGYTLQIVTLLC